MFNHNFQTTPLQVTPWSRHPSIIGPLNRITLYLQIISEYTLEFIEEQCEVAIFRSYSVNIILPFYSFSDRMLECPEFPHAYDNPTSINSPARTTQRLPSSYTHHRTPSNVSNASTSSQSNINPTFRLEDEGDYSLYPAGHYYQRSPGVIYAGSVHSQHEYVPSHGSVSLLFFQLFSKFSIKQHVQ